MTQRKVSWPREKISALEEQVTGLRGLNKVDEERIAALEAAKEHWMHMAQENKRRIVELEAQVEAARDFTDKPQPAPSEPPSEDVATPELDALYAWLGSGAPPSVREAWLRDLSAGIAKTTKKLRKELETARRVIARSQDDAKEWEGEAAKMMMERDDLRRQLMEHAGECAACGASLAGASSYERMDHSTLKEVRVCDECGWTKTSHEIDAAIDARRAVKCAACGEHAENVSTKWDDSVGERHILCNLCWTRPVDHVRAAIDARRAVKCAACGEFLNPDETHRFEVHRLCRHCWETKTVREFVDDIARRAK